MNIWRWSIVLFSSTRDFVNGDIFFNAEFSPSFIIMNAELLPPSDPFILIDAQLTGV